MSFNEEWNLQPDNSIIYDESEASLIKIDTPIGKMKFFVNSIILFAMQVIVIVLYYLFYFSIKGPELTLILICAFLLIFELPLLYLNFVNYTKRMWDIVGNFHRALWFTIGLFVISFICIFLFSPAILFFYFAMIFMPGKLIKNSRET